MSGAGAVRERAAGRVRPLVKVVYGLPACALAAVGIPLYVHLPKFYTDVVGVNVAVLGGVLVLLRLVDAVTDPLIGLASDRTRSRFGRRRPYIALGALPTALAVYLLFTPPAGAATAATVWFAVWLFVLYLCWTIVAVPYESLAPELTFDYDERTALLGVREALLIVGTLAGAIVPGVLRAGHGDLGDPVGERATFQSLGLLAGPLIIASCWWCVALTRERPPGARPAGGGTGVGVVGALLARYRETLANRPFVILLLAYTMSAIGGALPATLIFYYVEYVLHSTQAGLFLAIYFVVGFLCLPPWVAAARRFGKKQAWLAAMAINTGAFIGVFLLQAFLIATTYPIDRHRHTAIRDAIAKRLRGDVVTDPLVPGRLVGVPA